MELEYQVEIQKNQRIAEVSVQKLMTVSKWQGFLSPKKKRRAKVRRSNDKNSCLKHMGTDRNFVHLAL